LSRMRHSISAIGMSGGISTSIRRARTGGRVRPTSSAGCRPPCARLGPA
jgi:hypothetical protein